MDLLLLYLWRPGKLMNWPQNANRTLMAEQGLRFPLDRAKGLDF